MKAVLSGALVLLMTVASYGGQLMIVHSDTGVFDFDVSKIDSITFLVDSITDARDGQRYAIEVIGSQLWMAENLNYGTRIDGSVNQTNNTVVEKYAYNNHPAYADTFGGLYQWDEAMNYSTAEGVQGICPDGWRIPTNADWTVLVNAYGGAPVARPPLQAGGASGFNALYAGYRGLNGVFELMGFFTGFWCSAQYTAGNAWFWSMQNNPEFSSVDILDFPKAAGVCVRCVRDLRTVDYLNN